MRITSELRLRTKRFGSGVIRIFTALPQGREELRVIGRQMLRSGTAVPAAVREASRARSDAEFCSKLDSMLQEADETQLWIEYLIEDCKIVDPALPALHREAEELVSIFTTIVSRVRKSI